MFRGNTSNFEDTTTIETESLERIMRALAWEPMVPFSWDIGEGLKLRQPHEVLYLSPRLSINFLLHQVLAQAWLNKDHKDYQKHRQMFINVAKVVDCKSESPNSLAGAQGQGCFY